MPTPRPFGLSADSECFSCSKVEETKTAELLYASPHWDYYYCYSCRGWFKKPFKERRVILPVTDRREVRQLTWMYTSHLRATHENRVVIEWIGHVLHGLERRLLRV